MLMLIGMEIKIKTAAPTSYTPTGLQFDDGTHLDADVIVFATGFQGNMRYLVEEIFGSEIAEQMGDFWALDREGEIKGAFKSCGRMLFPFPLLFVCGSWIREGKWRESG